MTSSWRHGHTTSCPKSGCSAGTSRRRKPAPLQRGHTVESARESSAREEASVTSFEIPSRIIRRLRASPSRSTAPPSSAGPVLQDPPNVAPVALVVGHGLAERVFDPRGWILRRRLGKLFGEQG